jgi:hypothetical protein
VHFLYYLFNAILLGSAETMMDTTEQQGGATANVTVHQHDNIIHMNCMQDGAGAMNGISYFTISHT